MKVLVLVTALLTALSPVEVCDACSSRKLCKPHASEVSEGLSDLKSELRSKDVEARCQALTRAAQLNGAHTNAPSKAVTKVVAAGLEDDDFTVRATAAELLRTGQDPETAVEALAEVSGDVGAVLSRIKRSHPDAEVAMKFATAVVESIASYEDDRSVEALANLLERHTSSLYGTASYRILEGLIALASQDAIEAVLSYHELIEGFGDTFAPLEEYAHKKLTAMATARGLTPAPAWSDEGVNSAWRQWFEEHGEKLPKKLGKASLPEN